MINESWWHLLRQNFQIIAYGELQIRYGKQIWFLYLSFLNKFIIWHNWSDNCRTPSLSSENNFWQFFTLLLEKEIIYPELQLVQRYFRLNELKFIVRTRCKNKNTFQTMFYPILLKKNHIEKNIPSYILPAVVEPVR